MYEILTSKFKDVKLKVNIENPNPTGIPKIVMVGGGKVKTKYAAYLEEHGFSNNKLLQFLVLIHKEAKKEGKVALMCTCKSGKESHADVLKEYILKNRETYDVMIPYLFPGEPSSVPVTSIDSLDPVTQDEIRAKMQQAGVGEVSLENQQAMQIANGKLSEEDMSILKGMIEADQRKQSELISEASSPNNDDRLNELADLVEKGFGNHNLETDEELKTQNLSMFGSLPHNPNQHLKIGKVADAVNASLEHFERLKNIKFDEEKIP